MKRQPDCLDCKYNDRGFPCRRDGVFDAAVVARGYLAQVLAKEKGQKVDAAPWAWDCFYTLQDEWPSLCLDTILICLTLITTTAQASVLAAGPLEAVIAEHGETIIDRIELLARRSPRFRNLLTGVWPQGQQDSPIWPRIVKARGEGRHIDDGGPLPPVDDWLSAATPPHSP